MKIYIWLTLYFIWLIWISYTFFFITKKENNIKLENTQNKEFSKKEKNTIQNNVKNQEEKNSIININKKIDELKKFEDKNSFQEIKENKQKKEEIKEKEKKEKEEEIKENKENEKEDKDKEKENIKIWKGNAILTESSWYKNIFSGLKIQTNETYKIKDKKIYIKILNSIDYEDKKTNISGLIQKIWGNIVETNIYWEKQLFINIDKYYKKEVIMLVKHNSKTYLLIIPYEQYQNYKKYLKEILFF